MPKPKFESIYQDLKHKIEEGNYEYLSFIPSEYTLIEQYSCSRNTVRRAISELAAIGYVQPMHGKGVRNIYQPLEQANFTIGGIESFKESAERNKKTFSTKVIFFEEVSVDERMAKRMGFEVGTPVYYIQRVRSFEGTALILDINIFSKELVPNLTPEIAARSIYDYIENTLGMQIVTSKRRMTVERITEADKKNLAMEDYDMLAVVTSQTFNADGMQFEYTQSRHRPDYFCFHDTASRRTLN